MKALVVGCGKVGSEIAGDLAGCREVSAVVAIDARPSRLTSLRKTAKITTVRSDISRPGALRRLMRDVDVVCGALPGRIGFELLRAAVAEGKNVVDISYTPQDPFRLHREALRNNCTVVPQCGVAPGLSNMCVGNASGRAHRILKALIFVGGLPRYPVPPLNYRVVFSLDDLINEYTRPVRIVENGKRRIVDPLTGLGHLDFPGVGRLEYFLTDGLGTLPTTFPDVQEMCELTLRYPGHAEIIDALRLMGFFDSRRVTTDGSAVEPRRLSLKLLDLSFRAGSPEDLLAFRVEVVGSLGRRRISMTYEMLDLFDRRHRTTAMARTTAYPCTSIALLVGTGKLQEHGVVPPERIGRDPELFNYVLSRLRERGVNVRTRVRTLPS